MAIQIFANTKHEWPESTYNGVKQAYPGPVGVDGGYQVTFGHDLRSLGKGDDGGPWLMEKTEHIYRFGNFVNPTGHGYQGPTLPWIPSGGTIPAPTIGAIRSDASYYADGAKAIAATEPTKAVFNGSTFLGETLQDGLPKMAGHQVWREKTLRAKQAGGEYLNYQFGWVPFVSDLRDFAYAVSHSSDIVTNYIDHSNVKIRRRLVLTDETHNETDERDTYIRTPWSDNIGWTRMYFNSVSKERMWFSGAYQYYVPVDNSAVSRFRRYKALAHKLYGVDLDPQTVWNIAPWSWAADWKGDVGSVIHNWSALGHNGLGLQYGYLMHEQYSEWRADAEQWGSQVDIVKRCRRVPANPYGFGVNTSGLNDTQVAILAAIGATRGDARIIR